MVVVMIMEVVVNGSYGGNDSGSDIGSCGSVSDISSCDNNGSFVYTDNGSDNDRIDRLMVE